MIGTMQLHSAYVLPILNFSGFSPREREHIGITGKYLKYMNMNKIFLQNFLKIAKRSLQNFEEILEQTSL